MSIRMRHTSSHSGRRRSHHSLKAMSVTPCPKCGKEKPQHTVCFNCGYYKNREVLDVLKKLTKKERKKKEKELKGQEEQHLSAKPLDAADLSRK